MYQSVKRVLAAGYLGEILLEVLRVACLKVWGWTER